MSTHSFENTQFCSQDYHDVHNAILKIPNECEKVIRLQRSISDLACFENADFKVLLTGLT